MMLVPRMLLTHGAVTLLKTGSYSRRERNSFLDMSFIMKCQVIHMEEVEEDLDLEHLEDLEVDMYLEVEEEEEEVVVEEEEEEVEEEVEVEVALLLEHLLRLHLVSRHLNNNSCDNNKCISLFGRLVVATRLAPHSHQSRWLLIEHQVLAGHLMVVEVFSVVVVVVVGVVVLSVEVVVFSVEVVTEEVEQRHRLLTEEDQHPQRHNLLLLLLLFLHHQRSFILHQTKQDLFGQHRTHQIQVDIKYTGCRECDDSATFIISIYVLAVSSRQHQVC